MTTTTGQTTGQTAGRRRAADVEVGEVLPPLQVRVTRADLVRYAGASLDFNPIHWNERFAENVGLPNVIAHGMLTMALACRLATAWAGDPGAVVDYGARFTRPVVVPDDGGGALVEISGSVTDKSEDGTVRVSIAVRCGGQSVLGRAVAVVKLA